MKSLIFLLLAACSGLDQPAVDSVESADTSYQGTSYQGTSYQGTSYQGTSYQGTSYQGTSYQGATYGGSTLSSAQVNGTAISTWKLVGATWEQRLPDRVCTWNYFRTTKTCTVYNLATHVSPLAGTTFQATFQRGPGSYVLGQVQIASTVGAVQADNSVAMFALNGSGATGTVLPAGTPSCSNPSGCRVNSDLWLYDLHLIDPSGAVVGFCPSGSMAFALAGSWDATGKYSSSNFTFACTTGTIAKCTRWGYRPWASAYKNDGTTFESLADYHQACVRAATADYCADGHSFTKNGTMVDVWDYAGHGPGYVPRTDGTVFNASAITAVTWESSFDSLGGLWIDHARYEELQGTPSYGSIDGECPGRFIDPTDDVLAPYTRVGDSSGPIVSIDSTPSCAHSELTVGKWLHRNCSDCTRHVPDYCNDPTDPRGWDQGCVDAATAAQSSYCSVSGRMTIHSECSATTDPLRLYGSGCTLSLCSDPAYASCCSAHWTSSCVAAANARCTGGREHTRFATTYGFCNTVYTPTSTNAP